MESITLNGTWECKSAAEDVWRPVSVPGTVLSEWLKLGVIEDPFYRTNETIARQLGELDYEYRRTFTVDERFLGRDRVVLVCEGLDTLAELSLNGEVFAVTDNMHRTYEFDVKPLLRAGENVLHIVFRSPVRYLREKQKERPLWCTKESVDGFPHLRKAHYMFGWDWGPVIPDAGIWRDIRLSAWNTARIRDVLVRQRHDAGRVTLHISVEAERCSDRPLSAAIAVAAPDGTVRRTEIPLTAETGTAVIVIDDPMLWWPNGFGKQPLYRVTAELAAEGERLDTRSFSIGLRTFTIRRVPDEWGESFEYHINGVSIFAMGANYIPQDNLLGRLSRERAERLIRDCVEANFNTIRVWGGAFYPHDWFYDLCDQYGLIVWQDFMFGCAVYEMTPEFAESIRREAEDNIRRLRHHPSLGLWCGNNEMEWAWVEWDVPQIPKLKTDYIKQFEVLLPEVVARLDPDRFYWPASPSSGGGFDRPNDPDRGDVHYWEVWQGKAKIEDFRKHCFRFCSEFGFQSFPSMKTIRSFTEPEDRNIFTPVMESHQKCGYGNGMIMNHLADQYLYPKDLDSLLYVSQLLQAEAVRGAVEHWRRNRGRCMGAIYWQLNDCWPVASWSGIDYFGRWKALHYFAKRFFAPVLLSAKEDGKTVELHVSNETLDRAEGTVVWALRDRNSRVLRSGSAMVAVDRLSSREAVRLDFTDDIATLDDLQSVYLEFELLMAEKLVSGGTLIFVKPKHFRLQDPAISWEAEERDDAFAIRVVSTAYAKYVELDLMETDGWFSDNYFDLTAGVPKEILLPKHRMSRSMTLAELRSRLKVRSLFDSYVFQD